MSANGIATYEEKVAHIELVAERGAAARQQAADTGLRPTRRTARQVFKAMAVNKSPELGGPYHLVLADTPPDRPHSSLSKAWARHVRRVFVASFVAGEPRPEPPRA